MNANPPCDREIRLVIIIQFNTAVFEAKMRKNIALLFLVIFAFSSLKVIDAKNKTGKICGPIKFKLHIREAYEPNV